MISSGNNVSKNKDINTDVCYCIILDYANYFKQKFKMPIDEYFGKKGFLLPVFDFTMHCLECLNMGAAIRFISYHSGLKNILIDCFIIFKIFFCFVLFKI